MKRSTFRNSRKSRKPRTKRTRVNRKKRLLRGGYTPPILNLKHKRDWNIGERFKKDPKRNRAVIPIDKGVFFEDKSVKLVLNESKVKVMPIKTDNIRRIVYNIYGWNLHDTDKQKKGDDNFKITFRFLIEFEKTEAQIKNGFQSGESYNFIELECLLPDQNEEHPEYLAKYRPVYVLPEYANCVKNKTQTELLFDVDAADANNLAGNNHLTCEESLYTLCALLARYAYWRDYEILLNLNLRK